MFNFATYDFSKTKYREISQHKTLLLKSLALFCKIQIIPNNNSLEEFFPYLNGYRFKNVIKIILLKK